MYKWHIIDWNLWKPYSPLAWTFCESSKTCRGQKTSTLAVLKIPITWSPEATCFRTGRSTPRGRCPDGSSGYKWLLSEFTLKQQVALVGNLKIPYLSFYKPYMMLTTQIAVEMVEWALWNIQFLHFPSHYLLKLPFLLNQGYLLLVRATYFSTFQGRLPAGLQGKFHEFSTLTLGP